MARTTKLELEQALIASQRDNHLLRETNSVLRASNEALRAKLAEAAETMQSGSEQEQANAAQQLHRVAQPVNWPAAPRTQRKLPAHFEAAREAAMRFGRVVRVGV